MFKSKKNRIIFFISIIVALFVVLGFIGKKIINPFMFKLKLNAPSIAYENENTTVIVDDVGRRLLVLDDKKNLNNIINVNDNGLIDNISTAVIYKNNIYIGGIKYIKDSPYINYDRIIKCEIDGSKQEIIYEEDVSRRLKIYPTMFDIKIKDDKMKVLIDYKNIYDSKKYYLCVLEFSLENVKARNFIRKYYKSDYEIYTAKFAYNSDKIFFEDYFGRVFSIENENVSEVNIFNDSIPANILPIDDNNIVWLDEKNGVIKLNENVLVNNCSVYFYMSFCDGKIIYDDDDDDGILHIYDMKNNELMNINAINFTFRFGILWMVRIVSAIYLIILILIFCIKSLVNLYQTGQIDRLKKLFIIIAIIITTIFISVFYTIKIYEIYKDNIINDIKIHSQYFAETIDRDYLKNGYIKVSDLNNKQKKEVWEKIYKKFTNQYYHFTDVTDNSKKNAYIIIYRKEGNKYISIFDSWKGQLIGTYIDESSINEEFDKDVDSNIKQVESYYYKFTPIFDENSNCVGALLYGQDYDVIENSIKEKCIEITFLLVSILVFVYLVGIEIVKFLQGLKFRKELIKKGEEYPEVALVRTLIGLYMLGYTLDLYILVLITNNLISKSAYLESIRPYLLPLPNLLASFGCATGSILFNIAEFKISIKKICFFGCISLISCCFLTAYAVLSENFILFCCLVYLSGVSYNFSGAVTVLMKVKPKDEKLKFEVTKAYSTGRVSTIIIANLFGGFLLQYISAYSIYFIKAFFAILYLILTMYLFTKDRIYSVKSNVKFSLKEHIKFLVTPPMVIDMFFLILPIWVIALGYTSYLFPIYALSFELKPMYVTSCYVVSRTLVLFGSDFVNSLIKKIDYWDRVVFAILLVGLFCFLFNFNTTITFAIVIYFLTAGADLMCMQSHSMIWPRLVEERKLNVDFVSNILGVWDEVSSGMVSLILSGFLIFGREKSGVVFGIYCIISMIIFIIFTQNTVLRRKKHRI